jgi:hypothetical protein
MVKDLLSVPDAKRPSPQMKYDPHQSHRDSKQCQFDDLSEERLRKESGK